MQASFHTLFALHVNYRLEPFTMMEHLQLFISVLNVVARFPAETMMNVRKKNVTIGDTFR